MEKQSQADRERQRTEKLASKMARKILKGSDVVTLNPRLYGLGGYRLNTDFYELTQSLLAEQGVETEIQHDTIPSGSDADDMRRDRLHVVARRPSIR